ncbi:MAG: hypothetical protein DRQ54_04905 [Gammaproteobacteria bacterium]|nr:MAG: hypothetical protein DRQ54_04905 [Gammaproteobacteria bacterium]RLA13637.1 MAG: hypothetical protein DRQ52_05885 [Gammaproteobacteria bacterium]
MMKMIDLKRMLAATALLFGVSHANAALIDFIEMADNTHGEQGYDPLSINIGGVTMTITGHATNDDDNQQFAYLDAGNAGLGSCKDITGSAQCDPGSDDNVTTDEFVRFIFSEDVIIDNLWTNNNHDGGYSDGDLINIAGTDYSAIKGDHSGGSDLRIDLAGAYATGAGNWFVAANTAFDITYTNIEFYISAIDVHAVPEPTTTALLVFGLGITAFGRKGRRLSLN